MKKNLLTRLGATVLSCALMTPIALIAQDHDHDHDEHRYEDKRHHDTHQWNDHEDRAYHMYWEQRHRPYVSFDSLSERDRQAYWDWRHNHSDSLLKIDIR